MIVNKLNANECTLNNAIHLNRAALTELNVDEEEQQLDNWTR